MKCDLCKKEYSPLCDYNQGRCPLHPPLINSYSTRFLRLFNTISKFFNRKK